MKEFIQERDPINVKNVGKPSVVQVLFKDIKDLTLEKDPMSVKSAVKPLAVQVPFESMNELILERTHTMSVNSVGNLSFLSRCFKGT
jgi:hypothetical protein